MLNLYEASYLMHDVLSEIIKYTVPKITHYSLFTVVAGRKILITTEVVMERKPLCKY
jgi:hypothetical protein